MGGVVNKILDMTNIKASQNSTHGWKGSVDGINSIRKRILE